MKILNRLITLFKASGRDSQRRWPTDEEITNIAEFAKKRGFRLAHYEQGRWMFVKDSHQRIPLASEALLADCGQELAAPCTCASPGFKAESASLDLSVNVGS
jgi:hypothetical protein